MDWISNEILFYGGIGIIAVTVLTAIVYFLVSRIARYRLNTRLNAEYGEPNS